MNIGSLLNNNNNNNNNTPIFNHLTKGTTGGASSFKRSREEFEKKSLEENNALKMELKTYKTVIEERMETIRELQEKIRQMETIKIHPRMQGNNSYSNESLKENENLKEEIERIKKEFSKIISDYVSSNKPNEEILNKKDELNKKLEKELERKNQELKNLGIQFQELQESNKANELCKTKIINDLNEKNNHLNEDIKRMDEEFEGFRIQYDLGREQYNILTEQNKQIVEFTEALLKRDKELEAFVFDRNEKIEIDQKKIEELELEIRELKKVGDAKQLEFTKLQTIYDDLQVVDEELFNKNEELGKANLEITSKIKEIEDESKQFHVIINNLRSDLNTKSTEFSELQQMNSNLFANLDQFSLELYNKNQVASHLIEENKQLIEEKNVMTDQIKNQHEQIESLKKELEIQKENNPRFNGKNVFTLSLRNPGKL